MLDSPQPSLTQPSNSRVTLGVCWLMISSFQLVPSLPVRREHSSPRGHSPCTCISCRFMICCFRRWFLIVYPLTAAGAGTEPPLGMEPGSCNLATMPGLWSCQERGKKEINLIREVPTEALILSTDALSSVFSCPKAKAPHGLTWPCEDSERWGSALISKDQHKKEWEKLKVEPKFPVCCPRPWGPIHYHCCSHRAAWLPEGVGVKHHISHNFSNCYTERQKERKVASG